MDKKAKFRFYITEIFKGEIRGTNDLKVAEDYSLFDECFVVDTETNEWLTNISQRLTIKEI